MAELNEFRRMLDEHGQGHLLGFCDELSPDHQAVLAEQLEAIDFDQLDKWIQCYVHTKPLIEIPKNMQPPEIIPADGGPQAEEARQRGEELLAAGKVAAFVVAGGQGTRLGYEGPKGCFEATPVVKKPLFRLFAEQIRAAANRYRVHIPWYILTSPVNDT
ncbi:MAG: UTP--glucose-1-phosphate uridylyltransferase, partial [Phycisphaerae bacterium]|nr:UTP--glucose-1-phosphate uridylyltransferase [Phycisphaerae bacterium]